MKLLERIVLKLTSGRFLLTVIAGMVFAYLACAQVLTAGEVMGVIGGVFGMYFAAERKEKGDQ